MSRAWTRLKEHQRKRTKEEYKYAKDKVNRNISTDKWRPIMAAKKAEYDKRRGR